MATKNGSVDETFGEPLAEATLEERVEAGRKFAAKLAEKIKGYNYKLKTQKSTRRPDETFVNVYINGRGGTNPGRIGIGKFATPILFPGNDESETESFVNALDNAGLKLKIFSNSVE